MSLESPITYAEWYWKHGVDAEKAFDETIEDAMSPLFSGLLSDIPEISDLPSGTQNFMRALAEPHSAGLARYLVSAGGEFGAEVIKDAIEPFMKMMRRHVNRR
ncbi:unnamed protein product, partial [marine sediment metagenome]